MSVEAANYNEVYHGQLTSNDTLGKLYERFNLDRPENFRGHSLIDGILNDKPFLPEASANERANALIDLVEQEGQRFGNVTPEERQLIEDWEWTIWEPISAKWRLTAM